jgi:hypothetical protein
MKSMPSRSIASAQLLLAHIGPAPGSKRSMPSKYARKPSSGSAKSKEGPPAVAGEPSALDVPSGVRTVRASCSRSDCAAVTDRTRTGTIGREQQRRCMAARRPQRFRQAAWRSFAPPPRQSRKRRGHEPSGYRTGPAGSMSRLRIKSRIRDRLKPVSRAASGALNYRFVTPWTPCRKSP